jgi:hypothetical protein
MGTSGMKRHVAILFTAVGVGLAASASQAHHSHPYFYDQCRSLTIEGRIDSVQWRDPHTLIVVRLDDGAAYTVDWGGLAGLTHFGIVGPAKGALVPGVRVAVTGHPIRSAARIRELSPDFTGEVNPNTVDPTLIRRTDDTWRWARTPADRMPDAPLVPCTDPAGT